MPLYDYDCSACGRRFEVVHGVHAEGPTTCPICGKGQIHKAISAPAVHFKGTGWAKKERRATATPGTSKASDGTSGEGSHVEGGAKSDDAGSPAGAPASTATKPAESGATSKAD
ncbi:MAG: zinc ribbon domain-containing protein [Chloroflexi bacterium]|nr:zinc ribbon domain-containing protein [Chloroflexota bacterium]